MKVNSNNCGDTSIDLAFTDDNVTKKFHNRAIFLEIHHSNDYTQKEIPRVKFMNWGYTENDREREIYSSKRDSTDVSQLFYSG